MTSANDNQAPRKVRDGYLKAHSVDNFASVASDDALLRLAEARNAASKSANIFMMAAALTGALYFFRLQGVAGELSLGDYRLANLPFGLFVLSCTALIGSTVSLIRFGDSRAYDRQLMLACEQRYDCDCELRYLVFPNEHGWGEPFSKMAHVVKLGWISCLFRNISFLLINLFLAGLALAPVATGIDFLFTGRWSENVDLKVPQIITTVFLVGANVATILLITWVRLVDRD